MLLQQHSDPEATGSDCDATSHHLHVTCHGHDVTIKPLVATSKPHLGTLSRAGQGRPLQALPDICSVVAECVTQWVASKSQLNQVHPFEGGQIALCADLQSDNTWRE